MWWHSFREIVSMLFFLLNIVLSVGCSIVLISQKNDPVKTLSWATIMLSLLYIGIVLSLREKPAKGKKLQQEGCR